MIRHIVIAALRNMAANRMISAIAVLGLAAGIAVAFLTALLVRSELTYDYFIPGHERTYEVTSAITVPGHPTSQNDLTLGDTAALFTLNLPGIESVTRLMPSRLDPIHAARDGTYPLRHGGVAGRERIYWADANLASVLPLPVFRGNLAAALARPDGLVLTRTLARKYFGHDDAFGETILLNGHPMTVGAVIEDIPERQSELEHGIFASALASFSGFSIKDKPGNFNFNVHTYLRLKAGSPVAAVEAALPGLVTRLARARNAGDDHFPYDMSLKRIDRLNLDDGLNPGARPRLAVEGLVGLLILFIAAVNFVNLLTARAARRAREVGVRKACGAGRSHLTAQFLGEAVLTVAFAACLGVALAEWLLPRVNTFLVAAASFDYWRNTALLPSLLLAVLVLGVAAGAWPALVLSAFRPAKTLKDAAGQADSAGMARKILISLQFIILIVLIVSTVVVWQQRIYATQEGLRAQTDKILLVSGNSCNTAFQPEVRKLPGVEGTSCSGQNLLENSEMTAVTYKGTSLQIDIIHADWNIFALYGIKPLAGTLPAINAISDASVSGAPAGVVLNALAVRQLGLGSPQNAVGQRVTIAPARTPSVVVAVVPDFAFYSVARKLEASIYTPMQARPTPQQLMARWDSNGDGAVDRTEMAALSNSAALEGADVNNDGKVDLDELTALVGEGTDDLLSIRLRGAEIPETLAAIDRLWSATGNAGPIERFFLDAHVQELYLDLVRQAELLGALAGMAVLLACLGMFGIAVATAERRTKEIGVRKAMGADNAQIVALLLWQFAQPVLWASVIAWPAAWWLMRRWLSGFAYHVDLHWWVFAAASLGALLVALLTVAGQAWVTARRKPVLALRYE